MNSGSLKVSALPKGVIDHSTDSTNPLLSHSLPYPVQAGAPLSALGFPRQFTYKDTRYLCRELLHPQSDTTSLPGLPLQPKIFLFHETTFLKIAETHGVRTPGRLGALYLPDEHLVLGRVDQRSPTDLSTIKARPSELHELRLTTSALAFLIGNQNEIGGGDVLPKVLINVREECQRFNIPFRADFGARIHLNALLLKNPGEQVDTSPIVTDEGLDALVVHSREMLTQSETTNELDVEAFRYLKILRMLDPKRFDSVALRLACGFLPSEQGLLPEDLAVPYHRFAGRYMEQPTSDATVRKEPGTRPLPVLPTQPLVLSSPPSLSPLDPAQRNKDAHRLIAREPVGTQAARLKAVYTSPEFEREIRVAAREHTGVLVPDRASCRAYETATKRFIQIEFIWRENGSELRLRFHTKTNNGNDEIPNFRVSKTEGKEKFELVPVEKHHLLRDRNVQDALGIKRHDDGRFWVRMRNASPPGEGPHWRATRDLRGSREMITLEDGRKIKGSVLDDIFMKVCHIDYTPVGLEVYREEPLSVIASESRNGGKVK